MNLPRQIRGRSAGFTMIELLIVIAIIAVLVAMLAGVSVQAIAAANRARNRSDISNLNSALASFKNRYKVDFVPSRIVLCERLTQYNLSNQVQADSLQYLQRLWPRIYGAGNDIDWNGNGTLDGPWVLEGDQCLVFFLGGIPAAAGTPGVTGFSTNPTNPAAHITTGSADVIPPFFEFQSARLVRVHPTSAGFFSYADIYAVTDGNGGLTSGAPFAYYSTYKARNTYNRYAATGTVDCQTLGVLPYAENATPVRYLNPESFQIISAGADGMFGSNPPSAAAPFSLWTPAAGPTIYVRANPGYDDQTNFYETTLGR